MNYKNIILCLFLICVSISASAKWEIIPASSGTNFLPIIANPKCQPQEHSEQKVGNYVVKIGAWRACKLWVVAVDNYDASVAVTDTSKDLTAAQNALLAEVQQAGGTDDEKLAKQASSHNAEPVFKWLMAIKQRKDSVDNAYVAAKEMLPALTSCTDAVAMKMKPSAPRYATTNHEVVRVFSHNCSFDISYTPDQGWTTSNFEVAAANAWYGYCHTGIPMTDITCGNTEKELQQFAQERY